DESQNIEAGLRYFAEGGNDPVGRRLYYFGGPKARQHYDKTGQIPNISDGNMTASQYVKATGGLNQSPQDLYLIPKTTQPVKTADPYLVPTQSQSPPQTEQPQGRGAQAQPTP